jgi:hypothetical protein
MLIMSFYFGGRTLEKILAMGKKMNWSDYPNFSAQEFNCSHCNAERDEA